MPGSVTDVSVDSATASWEANPVLKRIFLLAYSSHCTTSDFTVSRRVRIQRGRRRAGMARPGTAGDGRGDGYKLRLPVRVTAAVAIYGSTSSQSRWQTVTEATAGSPAAADRHGHCTGGSSES